MYKTKVLRILNKFICLFVLIVFASCSNDELEMKRDTIFATLSNTQTGINFKNTLVENDSLNYFTYSYLYMGGGVAAGDINNDGLIDLYFTGNQVQNKLYLNKGNLQFEDITDKAGVSGDNRWYTGVTMADVNGDGLLDIYCSVSGKFEPRNNQLYINNGDNTFTEKAKELGLDDAGNSVQGTFLDYDKDGDLDLYVANYPPTKFKSPTFAYVQLMRHVTDIQSDHLYRNDGETFTNVTNNSGLKRYGLSLSATVGDLNNDSWPDLYISNDFNSPDFMYINQQDGTFREVIKKTTAHTAFYGMGVDISDFNNDGNLDIFQVDMDAQNNRRQKANMASMNPDLFHSIAKAGFQYQYMQNCLQVNSGIFKDGNPNFANISRLTGTSSTDWSWGPLFADFDNDGYKDLFISNGTRREINNNDYFNSIKDVELKKDTMLNLSLNMPSEKIDNFMFKNKGNLDFERVNKSWGIEFKGFSNGVVYADLDADGDLEVVTNNIDDYASVFKNSSSEINNYVSVQFKGEPDNYFGIGNRVYVKTKDQHQMQELTLARGFQSSVAPELHFGLGKLKSIDELKVVWTNGKTQILNNVNANQKIILDIKEAENKSANADKTKSNPLFQTVKDTITFPQYIHQENYFDDFKYQVLLPHKMSTFGPSLAVGDLNNDSLEDYFIGGSSNFSSQIFFQTTNGFKPQNSEVLAKDKISEDSGALIFDADNDGDNDLYVVSGGYEFSQTSNHLKDRLYLNDGSGNFLKADETVLPNILSSGSNVYNADFDKDGKQDLLVLGRQVPKNYPAPTSSYLLKNTSEKGKPKFDLFSDEFTNVFKDIGMATSAIITDFNNDTWPDIIIVGEWMPIKVYQNTKTGFKDVSEEVGLTKDTTGWWWSINQGDFDNDGDIDYVLGNNGLNYKYKANKDETFDIFVNDFDKDKKNDIVLSYYSEGKQYPVRGRECSSQQIPGIKNKFKDYETFSQASLIDVYSEKALKSALHYQVKSFASIYLENKNGQFVIHELPIEAQFSSINKILVNDYDKDGILDVLIAGNLFHSEVETPRNDASHGLLLKGDGIGGFKPVSVNKSGFFAPGDVKNMETINVSGEKYIIISKNSDYLQFVKQE